MRVQVAQCTPQYLTLSVLLILALWVGVLFHFNINLHIFDYLWFFVSFDMYIGLLDIVSFEVLVKSFAHLLIDCLVFWQMHKSLYNMLNILAMSEFMYCRSFIQAMAYLFIFRIFFDNQKFLHLLCSFLLLWFVLYMFYNLFSYPKVTKVFNHIFFWKLIYFDFHIGGMSHLT